MLLHLSLLVNRSKYQGLLHPKCWFYHWAILLPPKINLCSSQDEVAGCRCSIYALKQFKKKKDKIHKAKCEKDASEESSIMTYKKKKGGVVLQFLQPATLFPAIDKGKENRASPMDYYSQKWSSESKECKVGRIHRTEDSATRITPETLGGQSKSSTKY